ncbi:hypothetical protein BDW72DRAFT_128971 [Aspergillus terricola var. indicus]
MTAAACQQLAMRLLCFPLGECGLSALVRVSWGKLTFERLVIVQHPMFCDIVTTDERRPMISLSWRHCRPEMYLHSGSVTTIKRMQRSDNRNDTQCTESTAMISKQLPGRYHTWHPSTSRDNPS